MYTYMPFQAISISKSNQQARWILRIVVLCSILVEHNATSYLDVPEGDIEIAIKLFNIANQLSPPTEVIR